MNYIKTGLLMVMLMGLLLFVGHILDARSGGYMFTVIFLFFGLGMNFITYWFSDKIVLALYKARPVSEMQEPELYNIVKNLSRKAGIPCPRVYIAPMHIPNAFATGRSPSHAAVCVTEGILQTLPRNELEGVLAHELSHVKHYDTLIMTMCAAIAGIIMFISRMALWSALLGGRRRNDNALGQIFLIIIAPLLALMIQMMISRTREYKADEAGGRLTGDPESLADALLRLESAARHIPFEPMPATSHLFIVNPAVEGKKRSFDLFSTHPATSKRVQRLKDLAMRLERV
jgi:heat shock protein HtpX